MAGIHANAHVVTAHGVDDGLQFLETSAHLAALARHSLQKHRHGVTRFKSLSQSLSNVVDARIHSLTNMTAGMEIVVLTGQSGHAAQIIRQHIGGKGTGFGILGTQVHGISAMSHQRAELLLFESGHRFGGVHGIFLLCLGAPGISCKERKGIGPDGFGGLHHGQITCGSGQMTSDIIHNNTSMATAYHTIEEIAN